MGVTLCLFECFDLRPPRYLPTLTVTVLPLKMYSSLDDDPNRTPKLPILGPASSRVLPALSAEACSVPPPPPAAQAAIAQVEGGGGAIGAVSFVIGQPAIIK